jgi:hypothetical protein
MTRQIGLQWMIIITVQTEQFTAFSSNIGPCITIGGISRKKGPECTHGAYGLRLAAECVTMNVMIPNSAACISSTSCPFQQGWENDVEA